MIVLQILFIVFTFTLIHETRRFTYAESIVLGFASVFLAAFLFTEILSAVNLLTSLWINVTWAIATLFLLIFVIRRKIRVFSRKLFVKPIGIYFIVIFIAIITFVIAVVSPITNADSLTYHLSRIMYWIQHNNVDQFATNNHRQVSYQPLAEYLILNIKLSGGKDQLANLVQWFCFMGCLLNGYSIGKLLDLSEKQRSIVVFLIATIPMAILQSSSTQNDLIAAFFVSLFFVGFLKYKKEQRIEAVVFLVSGLALGGLIKGTVYIFILPFCIDLAFFYLKNSFWKNKQLQFHILLLIVGFLLINGAYFVRNYVLFNNIFGTSSLEISNEIYGFRPFISNIVRQFTLQLGIWSPHNIWNDMLLDGVNVIHNGIGFDISDSRTTFGEYDIKRFSLNEDFAANTLHFILLLIATGAALFNKNKKSNRKYWLMTWSGLFIFVILIKWQVFANRLLLPWFVISMPLIVKSIDFSNRTFRIIIIAVFTVTSLPFLLLNSTRPLISYNYLLNKVQASGEPQPVNTNANTLDLYRKGSILFMEEKDFYAGQADLEMIISIAESLDKNIKTIGLDVHRDFEDYLLLSRVVPQGVIVKHINTDDPFSRLEERDFAPQVIISTKNQLPDIIYINTKYTLKTTSGSINVYCINNI